MQNREKPRRSRWTKRTRRERLHRHYDDKGRPSPQYLAAALSTLSEWEDDALLDFQEIPDEESIESDADLFV